MNILITGAKGFVGSHLGEYLADQNNNVYLTARDYKNPKYIFLNLLDADSVADFIRLMSGKDIDVLIHTAGELVSGEMSQADQITVFEHNVSITKNVVKIIQELNIKRLINCSSMAVYPNEDGIYDETSEIRMSCNSDCMYGLSKFCAENMFEYILKNQCNVVSLRLSQIYGEDMRQDRIIPVMKKSIIDTNMIKLFGEGKRKSNFIKIDKVCEIISKLLSVEEVKGVLNVGDENISYLELAQRIIEKYGNSDTEIILINDGIKPEFVLNSDKLNQLLGNMAI